MNSEKRYNCPKCGWAESCAEAPLRCPDCNSYSVRKSAHRPGRGKAARQRARQAATDALEQAHDEVWGQGGDRNDRENNRLVSSYLRWRTDDVTEIETTPLHELRARELALLVTRRNMLSGDEHVVNAAVKNLISMERQNQADERSSGGGSQHQHLHLHQAPGGSQNPYLDAPMEVILEAKLALEKLERESH